MPPGRLLTKLKMLGIHNNILTWIANFLQNRMMRVRVNGECSDWAYVWSRIPQGSVLGPLLFLIFVNNLLDWIRTNIRMFADDRKVWNKTVTEADVAKLQENLKQYCVNDQGDGRRSSTPRNVLLCTLGTLWTVVITWFRTIRMLNWSQWLRRRTWVSWLLTIWRFHHNVFKQLVKPVKSWVW